VVVVPSLPDGTARVSVVAHPVDAGGDGSSISGLDGRARG